MNASFLWGVVLFASCLAIPLTFHYAAPLVAWLTLPAYLVLAALGIVGFTIGDPRDINRPQS